ncbi:signal recognition particle-docking protein FtsY [Synechococcus sp. A15-44]|uniref:signal recognition particle-docking protein FtsY n=1 Tax=Synechococcus sp. A15-44 TaxID=1050646 RepID=UPI0016443274|nr:signal recognition particle-docking protein FtsY [Synechococcus sp. A15-44]QNI62986.1 signal recognition particle-docking protein FtsY [Synechococcus sp. A15-44]
MVFNWFERQAEESPTPEPTPTPAPTPEPMAGGTDAPVSAAPEPTPAPAASEEEDEALVWAREAYARLKAQQQAAASVAEAAPQPTPAPSPEPAPTPSPTPTPGPAPLPTPSPLPSQPPNPTPTPAPAPGPSLLEQAAAQRQQRQQDLDERALEAPPAPTPAPTPVPAVESEEPQLGDFDQDFTWSAEVLAAQGRQVDQVSLEEIDWLGRLRRGLEKTRQGFVTSLLENLGDDPLTPEVLDDLETLLLRADAGVQATDQVLDALRQRMNEEVVDPAEGIRFLKEQLRGLLDAPIQASGVPLLAPERDRLNIWLMVGVNGVGKTTTLGKLANLAVRSGYSALIAAADTFRAAAVQQVEVWGERSDVPVVSNPSSNADPAAVVFDAIGAARSRKSDLLLVDTAGRLQTKHNLMEELQKVRKIIDRLAPEAKVESLLVLDASQGQNGLRQAMAFAQAAGLTGVVITKLDGTARGGVALAVSSEAGLPIRFIGAGEGIRDLRPFNSFEFVEALLAGR